MHIKTSNYMQCKRPFFNHIYLQARNILLCISNVHGKVWCKSKQEYGYASKYSILFHKYVTGKYPWDEFCNTLKSLNMWTINIVNAYVLIPPFSSNAYT